MSSRNRQRASARRWVLLFSLCLILTGLCNIPIRITAAPAAQRPEKVREMQGAAAANPKAPDEGRTDTVKRLIEYVSEKIVRIDITWNPPVGTGSQLVVAQAGTGFIFHQKNYILTNAHIVSSPKAMENVKPNILIGFDLGDQGYQFLPGNVVGIDVASDLAVLEAQGYPLFGDRDYVIPFTDEIEVGDDVFAIGFARGESSGQRGRPTVTRGIVSALGRSTDEGLFSGVHPDRRRPECRKLGRAAHQLEGPGGGSEHQRVWL
jgi:S1-C subfamily serine protease